MTEANTKSTEEAASGSASGFTQWLEEGVRNGYCTEPFCITHDSYPMHSDEEAAWDEGWDPCATLVRLGGLDDWAVEQIGGI